MKPRKYKIEGYEYPQLLDSIPGLRLIRSGDTVRLQSRISGKSKGEFTDAMWIDIPVYNENEELLGYDINLYIK
jgi:hypothetical protein